MAKSIRERLRRLGRKIGIRLTEACLDPVNQLEYECPLCGTQGAFRLIYSDSGMRFGTACPTCKSRERHRMIGLWLQREAPDTFGRVLHFAPEPVLAKAFRAKATDYVTADITSGRADLVLNIEDIALDDGAFDTVLCNHVLEHVDDTKALAEIYRVLAPGGLAVLTTPVIEEWEISYEPSGITDPKDLRRHFGQRDHVRYFGKDIFARIEAAGFDLSIYANSGDDAARYNVGRGDRIFLAHKP